MTRAMARARGFWPGSDRGGVYDQHERAQASSTRFRRHSVASCHRSKTVTGTYFTTRTDIKEGKFAFTTDAYDVYEVCFTTKMPSEVKGGDREVQLLLKHGAEAKNYQGLADVGKLKPLEMKLQQLEDLSEAVVKDFAYMRQREEEMRDTNELTNSRVLYFSIFSMCCLLGLATWQVLYLRRFFKAKKLIE
ncbi:hypothetical protein HPB50_010114 [Hyalomma asiaticum]|uniref:Uncharacterized protein n=1 Tax=Hyalomma asiaticum TaxID=266040 RepID=A0ACB7RNC5_HYAAI|nr:hypothetical protein HPB50_010114 [Hyalomma asiaticum]